MQILQAPSTAHWSGKDTIPKLGDPVGCPFGQHICASEVSGYFEQDGMEKTYLGLRLHLLELPVQLERYGIVSATLRELETQGSRALISKFLEDQAFSPGLFGAEIKPAPEPPHWFAEHGLAAEEEFAALTAVALGGKDWEITLSMAWNQGAWHSTPYPELCGELQRIRNSAGKEFIQHAIKKNEGFLRSCKIAIEKSKNR